VEGASSSERFDMIICNNSTCNIPVFINEIPKGFNLKSNNFSIPKEGDYELLLWFQPTPNIPVYTGIKKYTKGTVIQYYTRGNGTTAHYHSIVPQIVKEHFFGRRPILEKI